MTTSLAVPKSALTEIANSNHTVIEFPTERRLSHRESEQLCDAIEARLAELGIEVRAAHGTNVGTAITIDVYKRVR